MNEKLQTAKKNSRNYQKPYEVPNPRNDLQVKIAPGLPLNKRPAILQSEALKAAQIQRPNVNIYNQHLPTQFPQIPTIRSYPPPSNLQPSTSNQAVPLLSLIQSASNNQPTSSQHNAMLQPSASGSSAITATSLNAPADASVLQPLIDNQVDFELPNCITPIQQDPAWKQIPSGPDIMSWLDHNNHFSESPYGGPSTSSMANRYHQYTLDPRDYIQTMSGALTNSNQNEANNEDSNTDSN